MSNINKTYFIKNSPEQDENIIYRIPCEYRLQEYKNSKYLLKENSNLIKNVCKIYYTYINKNNIEFSNYKYNIFNSNILKKHFINKPKLNKIINFIHYICDIGDIEPECIIILLIYIERLLEDTQVQIQPNNWKTIIFCSMIIASKIIDDETNENCNFAKLFPQYNLKYINKLEKNYLQLIDYKVNIESDTYAKYYYYLYNMGD